MQYNKNGQQVNMNFILANDQSATDLPSGIKQKQPLAA